MKLNVYVCVPLISRFMTYYYMMETPVKCIHRNGGGGILSIVLVEIVTFDNRLRLRTAGNSY